MAISKKTTPKTTRKKNATPRTTAQRLGSIIKSARQIMRKDKGLNGDLDRLPLFTWIMFLKFLDDMETTAEIEAQVTGRDYVDHLIYDGTVQMPYETLKANMEKMTAAEAQESAPQPTAQAPAHPGILVVDDEVAVNNNIRKILGKKGYSVDQAVTKDEALERIETQTYSLVLLDLRIPGVNGLELLEAIVAKNPDTKVIMITGYASIETAVEAARMGAVDYLPKPFTPDEIRNATDRAFQLAA